MKAAADVKAPVDLTVTEVNSSLEDSPESVNADPEGDAWFVKVDISDTSQLDNLMNREQYDAFTEDL